MKRRFWISTVAVIASGLGFAQTPTDQLMAPPAGAKKFVIVSAAGPHGWSSHWKQEDGTLLSRESLLLRGMVWEQDAAIHLGKKGQPDKIIIRGVTPSGDAGETFTLNDGEARWKSPIDTGSKRSDGTSHYVTQGGTISSVGILAECLFAAPSRKLPLLPGGEARLVKLTDLVVGQGPTRQTVTAYSMDGLSTMPVPVWLDGKGQFFAFVMGLGFVPEEYAGEFATLEKAQSAALATRAPAIAKRFGITPATPVAFTHVKLFDADAGRYLDDQTVVADKGIITAVGAARTLKTPSNARVIDAKGKTLVPGLWDAHHHLFADASGPMLLSMGVTSVRSPGSDVAPTVERMTRIKQGELLYPTIYASVLIDGKGPLAAQGGVVVSSAEEAVAAVRKAKENGFTGVKFYGSMQREWLEPAIAEAKRQQLHIHGHIPRTLRPSNMVAAGYDELTHINMVMMEAMPDEVVNQSNGIMRFEGPGRHARNVDLNAEPLKSLIATLAAKQITVDPTLVTFEGLYVLDNGDLSPAYAPFTGTMPPVTERGFRSGGFAVPKDLTRADYRASFAKMKELVTALNRAKVPIVAGTDGSGLELIRELELYVEAGMTPVEALRTATLYPARLVNAGDSTGSIAVGKKADMVLVEGDPSKRVVDLRRTVWVMSEGRLMNADELRTASGFSGRPH